MLAYGRQTIGEDDIEAVVAALRAPQLTCGPLVTRFEQALAAWCGARHASACSSGTAALHLAYAALGIGPGDEIITTSITFSATAAAAYYVGATVRIADVDPRTGNISPASVEALVRSRTRAIVAVHLGGLPADLAELRAIAAKHGLLFIEDACHALGATYRGTRIGGATPGAARMATPPEGPTAPPEGDGVASDAVVFSFHPVKHITTGEGGAVIARDEATKLRIDRLRQHGIVRAPGAWSYEVQELGWNYRLPDIACALGLAQLAKLEHFVADRRALAAHYRAEIARVFGGIDGVTAPAELADRESAYHLFAVAIEFSRFGVTRDDVMKRLAAAGIGTQVHYIPLLHHPLHMGRCPEECDRPRPGSDTYFARTLSLPMFPTLSPSDATRVVEALHRVLLQEKSR